MNLMASLRERASVVKRRIAFPEGEDQRVLEAVRRICDRGFAQPVLIGDAAVIEAAAQHFGVSLEGIPIRAPQSSEALDAFIAGYCERNPGLSPQSAVEQVGALYASAIALSTGDVDALVAGALHTTARVIRVGLLQVGLAAGVRIPSSFFVMQIPKRAGAPARSLLFADCAVNVDPSAEALADIAIASAYSAKALLSEPARVALLSFSTAGSARHPLVDKVRQAVTLCRERAPALHIDGEFQVDTALDAVVAAKKLGRQGEEDVAGRANVLIFPDLNAGNIGYKLVQYIAGAQAIGPVLQGFARPLSDLSRGAKVDDIVATATVLAACCN